MMKKPFHFTVTEPLAKHPNLKLELELVVATLLFVSFDDSAAVTSIWKSICTSLKLK